MSIETALFLLRLLAGLCLAGFMVALFLMVWRSMKESEQRARGAGGAFSHLILEGPAQDQSAPAAERFLLQPITTIGRGAGNSIVLSDDFASAEHARITLERGKWWLEDRASRNGTRLNDEAINRPRILADGDVIGIGGHRLHFKLELGASTNDG